MKKGPLPDTRSVSTLDLELLLTELEIKDTYKAPGLFHFVVEVQWIKINYGNFLKSISFLLWPTG